MMGALRRLWKRRVTGRPDGYQAYVSFPTRESGPTVGEVQDHIDDLERLFEGRLDVYARTSRVAIVSDPVPGEQFDESRFEGVVERIETDYDETHAVARLEKWRPYDDRVVKSYIVVPVKPLFPRETTTEKRAAPLAD